MNPAKLALDKNVVTWVAIVLLLLGGLVPGSLDTPLVGASAAKEILFTGDELADIIAFLHDDGEQHELVWEVLGEGARAEALGVEGQDGQDDDTDHRQLQGCENIFAGKRFD